jgi:TRAP-type C4-dicarboxylate transport system permease small subunit
VREAAPRPWAASAAARADRLAGPVCRRLGQAGAAALAAMGALTVADVLGRYLLNRPVPGALELSEFALVLLVYFGLGATGLRGSQVVVDIAVERFPPRLRAVSDAVNALLGIGFWALIAWRVAVQAREVALKGEVSTILGLPAAPFVSAVALGSAVMVLALLGRLLGALAGTRRG